jgi:hypothetical protein
MCDKVLNVRYTAGYGSGFLAKWERATGRTADRCCVHGCGKDATLGAHVWVNKRWTKHAYIVPFCAHHNSAFSCKDGHPESQYVFVKKGTRALRIEGKRRWD